MIAVIATLLVLLLLWQFGAAILLFLLSLGVAAAIRPLISSLTGKIISKRIALGIVYALLISAILSSIFLISESLFQDLQNITDDFVTGYDRAKLEWPERGTLFQQALAEQLPPSTDLYQTLTSKDGTPILQNILGAAQNFLSMLGNIAIILVLSLYWSADQLRFERLGLSLLPTRYHPRAVLVWRSLEEGVGAYLRSEFLQSALAGFVLWAGYSTIHIKYATLLAVWGAIARLIPWFGALIAVLPVIFVGVGISSSLGIWATIYTVAVLLLLKLFIEQRFFPRGQYSSLLIVLFAIGMAQAFGFIGVILAPPFAVSIQILFQQLYPFSVQKTSVQLLEKTMEVRKRLAAVRRHIPRLVKQELSPLMQRFHRLVRRTIYHIQEY